MPLAAKLTTKKPPASSEEQGTSPAELIAFTYVHLIALGALISGGEGFCS